MLLVAAAAAAAAAVAPVASYMRGGLWAGRLWAGEGINLKMQNTKVAKEKKLLTQNDMPRLRPGTKCFLNIPQKQKTEAKTHKQGAADKTQGCTSCRSIIAFRETQEECRRSLCW